MGFHIWVQGSQESSGGDVKNFASARAEHAVPELFMWWTARFDSHIIKLI
jgi:hypothetical protein